MEKKTFALFLAVLLAITANAQLRLGVKAGVGLNDLKLNNLRHDLDVLKTDNRAGFTGGVMLELGTPIKGLYFDGSLLYAHRSVDLNGAGTSFYKRDYLDVPVNVKYKFQIAGIENLFSPFVFTGPDFAFLVSKDNDNLGSKFSSLSTSWNVGGGVELWRHLQISVAYGMGMNKSVKNAFEYLVDDGGKASDVVSGTDRVWTISAAYLF
ncbi:MAG: porin family protein [Muribaculaceae bacterium]|nr:porin family protein [Muribaculaceae bacterium]